MRKPSAFRDSIYPAFITDNYVEALDNQGKPLCLMPQAQIAGQKLALRAFAALAMAKDGSILLAEGPNAIFDITCRGYVGAGVTPAESAAKSLVAALGHAGILKETAIIDREGQELHLFSAIFSPAMLKAALSPRFLLTSAPEIARLAELGLISPFLKALPPDFILSIAPQNQREQGHLWPAGISPSPLLRH